MRVLNNTRVEHVIVRLRIQSLVVIVLLVGSLTIITNVTNHPEKSAPLSNDGGLSFDDKLDQVSQKLQGNLREYMNSGEEPEGFNGKLMVYSSSADIGIDTAIPALPLGSYFLHIIRNATPDTVRELYLDPDIRTILPDRDIDFSAQEEPPASASSGIGVDSFQADDILNIDRVHEELGITGDGVTIGVVDSGVDFGVSDLSNSAVLAPSGYLDSFDVTGSGIGLTSLTVNSTVSQGKNYLPLEDEVLDVFIGERFTTQTTDQLGIQLEDLEIGNIATLSRSGNFKVGMAYQGALVEGLPSQYFLFVLVDTQTAGVYDRLYVDMETSLAISLVQEGIIYPSTRTFIELSEFDLTNDEAFGPNNPIPAKDITGDGVNDVSMGGLGSVIDFTGLSGKVVVEGIVPSGRAIGMMFDPVGHGTLVASAAASDGLTDFPVFDDIDTKEVENSTSYNLRGGAPDAKIIAHKAFSISDFIVGWSWTGGQRLVFENENLKWEGDGNRTVDVSSNSWGNGEVAADDYLKGFDPNSLLLDHLSQNDTLFDGYPGTIFVVSGGNGAPGWGTVASPGMASMALTIGSSTYYHYLNGSTGRNDIAWFSARGPSSYGVVKPDLITPGHTGFVNVQLIRGLGNGTYAASTFGGTSEAAPRATGVIALLIQAAKENGIAYDFESLRLVLKSTATDLGFHPAQQGAGLINAFAAVNALIDNDVLVGSTYSSEIAGANLQDAYFKEFEEDHPLTNNPILDYVTSITPEQLASGVELELMYSNGTSVPQSEYTADAYRSELVYEAKQSFQTTRIENTFELDELVPANLSLHEFFELSISMDEPTWDNLFDNGLSTPDFQLIDDGSGDIVADTFSQNTWAQLLYSGFPGADFQGTPYLTVTDPGYDETISGWPGMSYTMNLRLFDDVSWNSIKFTKTDGNLSMIYESVPDELQTFYVEIQTNISTQQVPVLVSPNYKAEFANDVESIGSDLDVTQEYNHFEVANTFDWGYRPESGDFNHYRISVPEAATYLATMVQWAKDGMQPNMYLFNSTGQLVAQSDTEYIGGGFYETEISEPGSQNLLVKAQDTQYYLMVHTTNLPFEPGPHGIDVYFRYLNLEKLPNPVPTFSKSLTSPITGSLEIDSSGYSIDQFPEFRIQSIATQIYQGSNGTFERTVSGEDVDSGVNSNYFADNWDDQIALDLDQGEKVDLKLEPNKDIDVDFFVFKAGTAFTDDNELLKGTGTTPGRAPEIAKFAADTAGRYIVYIDYVTGLDLNEGYSYTLTYESRTGPTLSADGDKIEFNTNVFPDGNYGLQITFYTNFDYQFVVYYNMTTENSDDFSFTLETPSQGSELSGDVEVTWSSSREVLADVNLIINGTSIVLGSGINDSRLLFDSTIYPNGEAIIEVQVTDSIYSHTANVSVVIANSGSPTLDEITSSQVQSLSVPWFFIIGISVYAIYRRTHSRPRI